MRRALPLTIGGIVGVSALIGAIGFNAISGVITDTYHATIDDIFEAVFDPAIEVASGLRLSETAIGEMYASPSVWVFVVLAQYLVLYIVAAVFLAFCGVVAGRIGAIAATFLLTVLMAIYVFALAAILPPLAGKFGVEILPQILLIATTIVLGAITGAFLGLTAGATIGEKRRQSKSTAAAKDKDTAHAPLLEPVSATDRYDPYGTSQQRKRTHPRGRLAKIIGGLAGICAVFGTILGGVYGHLAGIISGLALTAVVEAIFNPALAKSFAMDIFANATMLWVFEFLSRYFGLYISTLIIVLAGKGLAGRNGAIVAIVLATIILTVNAVALGVMPAFAGGLGLGILGQVLLAAANIVLAATTGAVMGATAGAIIGTGTAKNE